MMIALGVGCWLLAAFAIAGWLAFIMEQRFRQRVEKAHERERGVWQAQLDKLASAIHYGQPSTPPAVVADAEPTAEERASRAFGEEAITNGVIRLREEYQKLGVSIPDEELKQEAISILFGMNPMPSVPIFVKDGPHS